MGKRKYLEFATTSAAADVGGAAEDSADSRAAGVDFRGLPVSVFWDTENVQVPKSHQVSTVRARIQEGIRKVLPGSMIFRFRAHLNIGNVPSHVLDSLKHQDIKIYDVNDLEKDASDLKILDDMRNCLENDPPHAVLVLSGDCIFGQSVEGLKDRNFLVLTSSLSGSTSNDLRKKADYFWDWEKLLAGEGPLLHAAGCSIRLPLAYLINGLRVLKEEGIPPIGEFLEDYLKDKLVISDFTFSEIMEYGVGNTLIDVSRVNSYGAKLYVLSGKRLSKCYNIRSHRLDPKLSLLSKGLSRQQDMIEPSESMYSAALQLQAAYSDLKLAEVYKWIYNTIYVQCKIPMPKSWIRGLF